MDAGLNAVFTSRAMHCSECARLLKQQPEDVIVVPAELISGHHILRALEVPMAADFTKARLTPLCHPILPWQPPTSYVIDLGAVTTALKAQGLESEMVQIEANTVGSFLDQLAEDW